MATRRIPRSTLLCALGLASLAAGCSRFSADGSASQQQDAPAPPPGSTARERHASVALVSVTPTARAARLVWRTAPGAPDVGVFVAPSGQDPFAGSPHSVVPAADGVATVSGLTPGATYSFGLAVEQPGGFEPIGPILGGRAADAVFVDPEASPVNADGMSPGTAFPDLLSGALTAFATGRNLWLRGGTFSAVSLTLLDGVDVYGGFAAGFVVAERDPSTSPTVLEGSAGDSVIVLTNGSFVLDGLAIDGGGVASNGVDVDEAHAEIRSVVARDCNRGLKLRSNESSAFGVQVVASSFTGNALQGMSIDGPFDLVVDYSLFEANTAEGVDADDLVAPGGDEVTLTVRDSVFANNGEDGLSIDLSAPLIPGPTPGRFRIEVEDCEFDGNVQNGLAIDVDYENNPGWRATIRIRGCASRANRLSGVLLDLDSQSDVLVHRLLAAANGEDGLLATSETYAGMATVSASALVGNLGFGARAAAGNFALVLSHCVVAGNLAGGFATDGVEGLAVSSVSYLQEDPYLVARPHHSIEITQASPATFVSAAQSFARVGAAPAGRLELGATPTFGVGVTVEVNDDGVARTVTAVEGLRITVDPHPAGLVVPASLAVFGSGQTVDEDYRPTPGSLVLGAGMPLPSGAPTDAGPFGAPLAGDPGQEDLTLAPAFYASVTTPAWSLPVPSNADFVVGFRGGSIDPGTLPGGLALFEETSGAAVPFSAVAEGNAVRLIPLSGSWSGVHRLELHPTLHTTTGDPLSAPIAMRIRGQ